MLARDEIEAAAGGVGSGGDEDAERFAARAGGLGAGEAEHVHAAGLVGDEDDFGEDSFAGREGDLFPRLIDGFEERQARQQAVGGAEQQAADE